MSKYKAFTNNEFTILPRELDFDCIAMDVAKCGLAPDYKIFTLVDILSQKLNGEVS